MCGKGYEGKKIIERRGSKETVFLFFAALFGGAIYLVATVLFHAAWAGRWTTVALF